MPGATTGQLVLCDSFCKIMALVRRWLSMISPNRKIIFLTGQSYPEMVRGARGCAYVHKEDALTDLLPGLEAALAGRQYLSSSVMGLGEVT